MNLLIRNVEELATGMLLRFELVEGFEPIREEFGLVLVTVGKSCSLSSCNLAYPIP